MDNPIHHQTREISITHLQQFFFSFNYYSDTLRVPKLHLFITFFITIITIHCLYQNKHRLHGLPFSYPFIGMLPSLMHALFSDNLHGWIAKILIINNGTFFFKGSSFDNSLHTVATSDPQNVEYLLKTNFSNFPKGDYLRTNFQDLFGDGIFSVDGESWLLQRKLSSAQVHSVEFRNMTTKSLLELVHSRLIPIFEEKIINMGCFDLQEILLRLTFDNVCMVSLGVDPGCLSLGLPEIPFARAFEEGTEALAFRSLGPMFVWKLMKFFNLGWEKRLKKSIKEVNEFVEEAISTRMKELNLGFDNNNNSRRGSDLLSAFMGLKDDEGKPFSYKFLRDICLSFILAGRDTSSVALCWFFWLLDQNPLVEERIVEELCQIVAEREVKEEDRNDVVFTVDEVKRMDYLKAVVSESLRLYPSLPLDRKEVVEDDVFPDGTILKKGWKLVYSIHAMGRMESIWGKDCMEFKPERWLKDGQFISESQYKFTAFNGGPRLCLGKDFAYYQMKFVAASIIYRYRVKVVENHPVVPKVAMTMYMKHGLMVTLKKRDE